MMRGKDWWLEVHSMLSASRVSSYRIPETASPQRERSLQDFMRKKLVDEGIRSCCRAPGEAGRWKTRSEEGKSPARPISSRLCRQHQARSPRCLAGNPHPSNDHPIGPSLRLILRVLRRLLPVFPGELLELALLQARVLVLQ